MSLKLHKAKSSKVFKTRTFGHRGMDVGNMWEIRRSKRETGKNNINKTNKTKDLNRRLKQISF